jgi:hypothetical protein
MLVYQRVTVLTMLKNTSSSMGRMTTQKNEMDNNPVMFDTTNQPTIWG